MTSHNDQEYLDKMILESDKHRAAVVVPQPLKHEPPGEKTRILFRIYEGQQLINVPPILKEGDQVLVTTVSGDQYIMKCWKRHRGQLTLLNVGKLEQV